MQREARTKLLWVIVSLGLLAAISLSLLLSIYRHNPRDPLTAVPANAQAVVLLRGAHLFNASEPLNTTIAKAFSQWNRLANSLEAIFLLDSLCRAQPDRYAGLRETNMVMAAIPIQDQVHLLFIADAVSGISEKRWKGILEAWGQAVPAQGRAAGMTFTRDGLRLHAVFSHNLLLVSSSQAVISMARETLNRPFRPDFLQKAMATAGTKVGATLMLPESLLEDLLLSPFPILREAFALTKPQAGWVSLDITLKKEDVLLTGRLIPGGQRDSWIRWFATIPGEHALSVQIPTDVHAFIHFASILDDATDGDLTAGLPGDLDSIPEPLGEVSWMMSMLNLDDQDPSSGQCLIIKHPTFLLFPDDSINLIQHVLEQASLPIGLLSLPHQHRPPFVFFASDSVTLARISTLISSGRSIQSAPWYQDYVANLPDVAGCWSRVSLDAKSFWSGMITGGEPGQAEAKHAVVSLDWAVRAGNAPFITLHLSSGSSTSSARRAERLPSTDAPLALSPTPVWDHNNKVYNILACDMEGQVYLFKPSGERLWKRDIKGIPMGLPLQVDMLKNNRVQYAFNTTSHIHVLDLNGRDVSGFPIALPQPASNALSVIDYNNKRDYRFLVAIQGGRVLNFDRQGKKTRGWSEPRMRHEVSQALSYITLVDKDFIIIPDDGGEVLMTGRRGESRINIRRAFANAPRTGFVPYTTGKEKRMLTTDQSGQIQTISGGGNIKTIKMDPFSAKHLMQAGVFQDNGEVGVVMIDEGWMRVFSPQGEKWFETQVPANIKEDPLLITHGGRTLIVLTDTDAARILVYQKGSAEPMAIFPGAFRPAFIDIDQDGVPEMVTGLGNQILIHSLD